MLEKCPCRYCENRHVGCHGTCNKYKEWALENEKLRKKVAKDKYYRHLG